MSSTPPLGRVNGGGGSAPSPQSTARGVKLLEDWENNVRLSEVQREAILAIQAACADLPFPEHLLATSAAPVRAESAFSTAGDSERDEGGPNGTLTRKSTILESMDPVETTQQFLSWFEGIEQNMEKGQEDIYRAYLDTVTVYRDTCDLIVQRMDETAVLFKDLNTNFTFVEERTRALQTACEKLLEEQNQLVLLEEEINRRLAYFNELENITRQLNAPGDACTRSTFIPMLGRLDECITFIERNPKYLDAELYGMRFRQCMTRSMTLVKMHVVGEFKHLSWEATQKPPKSDTSAATQLFLKFRTLATRVRPLIGELERRAPANREFLVLLKECFRSYIAVRKQVMLPLVKEAVTKEGNDVIRIIREGCAYLSQVCQDEVGLFRQFFDTGSEDLQNYLDSLNSMLYEAVRPLVIHLQSIDTLSEICQILYANLGGWEIELSRQDDDDEEENESVRNMQRRILADAQGRFVFRAEQFMREEVERFPSLKTSEIEALGNMRRAASQAAGLGSPTPAALATASALARSAEAPATLAVEEQETVADSTAAKPAEVSEGVVEGFQTAAVADGSESLPASGLEGPKRTPFGLGKMVYGGGEYYPTIQRTLYLLGKLYRAVTPPVFEDLAQEAVDMCRRIIVGISEKADPNQSKVDVQLFLMKNLLALREQIAAFDGYFVHNEQNLAFTGLTDILLTLVNPTTFISFGANIKVVESYADAKENLDAEVKRVCEEYIADATKAVVEPLSSFMLKASAFRLRGPAAGGQLRDQAFARPDQIPTLHAAFLDALSSRLKSYVERLDDYLGDRKTEVVLIRVIRANIVDSYRNFFDLVRKEYDPAVGLALSSVPDVEKRILDLLPIALRAEIAKPDDAPPGTEGPLAPPDSDAVIGATDGES
ncbi:Sec34-like family-domain-containing protein [Hyaloraphidium curvatum]|nr:Sec34-like family-domain-containing protein [Hyaloraphidium curvatum]